ncbi:MAG: LytR C-terminal domain-containing protein [Propionibacteriales bacterium]|nr:LytR C-terminal domain-containing protein [Propionibacteriales bacterium]
MVAPRRNGAANRNADGAVLPTRLMVLSISAVALGGLVFFATQGDDGADERARTSVTSTPAPSPSTPPITEGPGGPTTVTPSVTPTPKPPKPVDKTKIEVVVLNNTNITGLAGKTRSRAEKFDWNVINTGNWTGAIDESTVYYGPGLRDAAKMLAADLGIKFKPLFATNQLSAKRLNVILTNDYS